MLGPLGRSCIMFTHGSPRKQHMKNELLQAKDNHGTILCLVSAAFEAQTPLHRVQMWFVLLQVRFRTARYTDVQGMRNWNTEAHLCMAIVGLNEIRLDKSVNRINKGQINELLL
jgi:hypothetical protein